MAELYYSTWKIKIKSKQSTYNVHHRPEYLPRKVEEGVWEVAYQSSGTYPDFLVSLSHIPLRWGRGHTGIDAISKLGSRQPILDYGR